MAEVSVYLDGGLLGGVALSMPGPAPPPPLRGWGVSPRFGDQKSKCEKFDDQNARFGDQNSDFVTAPRSIREKFGT